VLERGEPFIGQRINIASDELSGREMAESLSGVTGRHVEYVEVPLDRVRAGSEDLALMFEWFDRVGYDADIAGLRRDFPEIGWQSFADWARRFEVPAEKLGRLLIVEDALRAALVA